MNSAAVSPVLWLIIVALVALLAGLAGWIAGSRKAAVLDATLTAERAGRQAQLAEQSQSTQQLRDAFAALSQQALQANSSDFLTLARTSLSEFQQAARTDLEARQQSIDLLVQPMRDGLLRVDTQLQAFDKERAISHAALHEQLRGMAEAQLLLTGETRQLVQALRAPQVRGQWGELQLRRVVELAGMIAHCDFVEQHSVDGEDGRLRPDLIVRLPGDKIVVVDSKAPLAAYLDAIDATDEEQRGLLLDRHARQVREHVTQLSSKDYANQFAAAPDFVVLFLPGESFFSAACQRDPSLIEYAVGRGVIPASPTTLITVLKAVFYGWQQERVARNTEQIRDAGIELYARMRTVAEHLARMKKGLDGAVTAYNGAVSSLETRVLPTARRLKAMGAGSGDDIDPLEPADTLPRLPSAPELVPDVEPQESLPPP